MVRTFSTSTAHCYVYVILEGNCNSADAEVSARLVEVSARLVATGTEVSPKQLPVYRIVSYTVHHPIS